MKQAILFHTCGILLACGCGWMTWFSFWVDPYAVTHEVNLFLTVIFIMSIVYAGAAFSVSNKWVNPSCRSIILWALVFRAILFSSQPILETDWNRYLWDGFVSSQGMNPYQYPPAFFLDSQAIHNLPEAEREVVSAIMDGVKNDEQALAVFQDINNATVNTIYPPFMQWLFLLSTLIHPFSLLVWRCIILFFDGLLLYCIVSLLKQWNSSPALVIFYAWSPLVLKECINTTHFDGIVLSLLFLGIELGCQKRWYFSSFVWAAAVITKLFPFAVLLFWFPVTRLKVWCVFLIALTVLSIPFFPSTKSGFTGYAHFAQRWESNSSLIAVIEWGYQSIGVPAWNEGIVFAAWEGVPFTIDAFLAAKLTGIFVVALLFIYLMLKLNDNRYRQNRNKIKYTFILLGAILLFSPVANPWYITWVTPFLCFYPLLSWVYLSTACLLYYLFFTGERMAYSYYIREIEYIPFFLLLLYEMTFQKPIWQEHKSIESDTN